MKMLRVYEGRRGGNWAMVIHFKRNLLSFLIAATLFTSVVDGQYGLSPPPPRLANYTLVYGSPPPPRFANYTLVYGSPSPPFRFPVEERRKLPVGIIGAAIVVPIVVIGLIAAAALWKCKKMPAKEDVEQPVVQVLEKSGNGTAMENSVEVVEVPAKSSNGTAVEKSMEVVEVSAKSGNETAVEKTTSAAKESRHQVASEGPITRPTERIALLAAATRHFTYNEILTITRNFSKVIGEGGSSTVYYGQLPEGGLKVAVKKLKESGSLLGNFLAEIKILMKVHHKNLVSLVGLCEEQDEIILVSEYMASGSLSELLKDRNNELTWRKRLQMALDAATGLEYLHTGCRPAIIHRDIKPANILLDEKLQAKLADFGLSKAGAVDGTEHSAYQTKVAGTMGYIDPEYLYTQTLTKKNDVYSFGVVLFELITGKPAMMITETNEKCYLTRWVMPMLVRGNIEGLLDPLLKGRCNIQSVWDVAAIAKAATQDPAGRPDMPEIVSTLKAALRMESSWVEIKK